jgi:hypothetical protein
MSENDVRKLDEKLDRVLEAVAKVDVRLTRVETRIEDRDGRCDTHARSIHDLDKIISKGNGKPGLVTLVSDLYVKMDGMIREITIYAVVGGSITSLLMTLLVTYFAAKWRK